MSYLAIHNAYMPLPRLDGCIITIGHETSKEGYYSNYTPRLMYLHV